MKTGKKLLLTSVNFIFAGFRIWSQRQNLASRFWNDVDPVNRELKERRKRRKKSKLAEFKCNSPFHFIPRWLYLSEERPTNCPCSTITITSPANKDIRNFLLKYPSISPNTNSLVFSEPLPKTAKPKNKCMKTRADAVRMQHDRGKKRKLSNLSIDLFF